MATVAEQRVIDAAVALALQLQTQPYGKASGRRDLARAVQQYLAANKGT